MYLKWLAAYFIVINLCGILFMYTDKKRARKHQWRISEKTLFLIALLGGSAGSIIGCSYSGIKQSTGILQLGCLQF